MDHLLDAPEKAPLKNAKGCILHWSIGSFISSGGTCTQATAQCDSLASVNTTMSRPGSWCANRTALASSCLSARSAEHTSELQSLMRISYAVFCLKQKKKH